MSATFTAEATRTGRGQYTWIRRQQRDGKSKVNTLFLLLTRSAASAERQFAIYIKRSSSQLLKLETKSRKKSQVFMSKWHEFFRAIAQRMNSTWEPRERRQWHYTAMIFNSKFSICRLLLLNFAHHENQIDATRYHHSTRRESRADLTAKVSICIGEF